MLLENQIENIRYTRSSEQAKAYLSLVKQLGICLKELRNLKKAKPVDEAWLMLNKLLATQECERKEMEEQMAEETHHLNDFQASYQRLVDDSKGHHQERRASYSHCSGGYCQGASLDSGK